MANPSTIEKAYKFCHRLASRHYENFPVASLVLPKKLRQPIAAIYAFARTADDFADEGNLSKKQRLVKLQNYQHQLHHPTDDPIFVALKDTIERHSLPITLFADLLTAFTQDVNTHRYQNFAEVVQYCKYSATPIGRLLLYLAQANSEENLLLSDQLCIALQLLNFLQDVYPDAVERGRCYLPLDDMHKHKVTFADLLRARNLDNLQVLLAKQLQRARLFYNSSYPLLANLHGLFGFEIKLIYFGAGRIIKKLHRRTSPFAQQQQVRLHLGNKITMLAQALTTTLNINFSKQVTT